MLNENVDYLEIRQDIITRRPNNLNFSAISEISDDSVGDSSPYTLPQDIAKISDKEIQSIMMTNNPFNYERIPEDIQLEDSERYGKSLEKPNKQGNENQNIIIMIDKEKYISNSSKRKLENEISIFSIKKVSIIEREKDKNTTLKSLLTHIKKEVKRGRRKINSIEPEGYHTKFRKDNIIRKFKVKLIRKIFDYINNLLSKSQSKLRLYIIGSIKAKEIQKDLLERWLDTTVKDLFSEDVSRRCKKNDSDYNRKIINKIYREQKETQVINIMNKTIREFWIIYKEDRTNEIQGFATMKDDILEMKNETENYIEKYKKIVKNFDKIIAKISRRSNKENK